MTPLQPPPPWERSSDARISATALSQYSLNSLDLSCCARSLSTRAAEFSRSTSNLFLGEDRPFREGRGFAVCTVANKSWIDFS
jgi:hypothetical protein